MRFNYVTLDSIIFCLLKAFPFFLFLLKKKFLYFIHQQQKTKTHINPCWEHIWGKSVNSTKHCAHATFCLQKEYLMDFGTG